MKRAASAPRFAVLLCLLIIFAVWNIACGSVKIGAKVAGNH